MSAHKSELHFSWSLVSAWAELTALAADGIWALFPQCQGYSRCKIHSARAAWSCWGLGSCTLQRFRRVPGWNLGYIAGSGGRGQGQGSRWSSPVALTGLLLTEICTVQLNVIWDKILTCQLQSIYQIFCVLVPSVMCGICWVDLSQVEFLVPWGAAELSSFYLPQYKFLLIILQISNLVNALSEEAEK